MQDGSSLLIARDTAGAGMCGWLLAIALGLPVALYACASGDDAPVATAIRPTIAVRDIEEMVRSECIVSMAPRNYDPRIGAFPTEEQLRGGLMALRQAGFSGVTTYTSAGSLAQIPRIAKELGFRIVGTGIWSPTDEAELEAAVRAQDFSDFYIVGNEGITDGRYTTQDLETAIERVRSETGKAVSTTDTLAAYREHPDLWTLPDTVLVNHHAFWAGIREPAEAARWTHDQYAQVAQMARDARGDDRVVFREVGWPTAGDPAASEQAQRVFFEELQRDDVAAYAYFEAFDVAFKTWHAVEPHWGIIGKPSAGVVCGKSSTPAEAASPTALATQAPPPIEQPTAEPVLETVPLGHADFSLIDVCTFEDNYCGYADRAGKAVVYGSMSSRLTVPQAARNLAVTIEISCNGWGEGLAGPPGSAALISVDGDSRTETIDAGLPFHHGGYFRYESCGRFTTDFAVAPSASIELRIEMTNGARLDVQRVVLTYS